MARQLEVGKGRSRGAARAGRSPALVLLALLFAWLGATAVAQEEHGGSGEDLLEELLALEIVDADFTLLGSFSIIGGDGERVELWRRGQDVRDGPQVSTCAVDGLLPAGQGAYMLGSGQYMSGSVGGLVLGDVRVGNPPETVASYSVEDFVSGSINDQDYRAADTAGLPALWTGVVPERGVHLVVADNFAGIYEVPDGLFSLTDGSESLRAVLAKFPVSHGALVLHHLNALLAATGVYTLEQAAPDGTWYLWRSATGAGLTVHAVDLAPLDQDDGTPKDTGELSSVLQEVLSNLEPSGDTVYAVINLSWVLLPCPTVQAFIADKDRFQSLDDYLAALQSENPNSLLGSGQEFKENALRLISYAGEHDPLLALVERSGVDDSAKVLFVAASGNFGMSYQMLPAAWPSVLGVGSPRGGQPPPPYSNAFEVSAPGAWFKLEPLAMETSSSGEEEESLPVALSYAGTSYSAPLVALFQALDATSSANCLVSQSGRFEHSTLMRKHTEDRPLAANEQIPDGKCPVAD